MPNFPLGERIQDHIKGEIRLLAQRPCDQIKTLFPLDIQDIQDLVLDRETCQDLQRLMDDGVKTIIKYSEFRIAFLRHTGPHPIPQLKRSVVVKFDVPHKQAIFVKYATSYGIRGQVSWTNPSEHYLEGDITALDKEKQEKLLWWIDKALHQERIKEIAVKVTEDVLRKAAATSTHLQVLFPALARIVNPDSVRVGMREQDYFRGWVEKLRNPARYTYNYLPEPWVEATLKPLFPIVETAINQGKLINHEIQQDHNRPWPEIEFWERLPRDVTFPLKKKLPPEPVYGAEPEEIKTTDMNDSEGD